MASHPSRIGSYVVEAHLGRGAVGDVYRAWDELLRRRVALKRLDPVLARSAAVRQRFHAAAQAAAGLDHPAIVRIHSLLADGDSEILVMELIEGETLARLLARGAVGAVLAERLAAELADALAAAHARGVVHGRLTAANVMVTPAGQAKILDFGLAGAAGMGAAADGADGAGGAAAGATGVAADLAALRLLREELLEQADAPMAPAAADAPMAPAAADAPGAPMSPAVPGAVEPSVRSSGAPSALPVAPHSPSAGDGEAVRIVRRRWRRFVAVGAIAAAAVVAALVLSARRAPGMRVAVAAPQIAQGAGIAGVDLLAAGLRVALVHTVASLDGVQALPLEAVDAAAGTPVAMARALGAAEVVTSRLSCQPDGCAVSVSRVAGRDGSLLWTQDLEAPIGGPYLLATAAESCLERAYPERSRRAGAGRLAVRPQDFESYLVLLRDLAAGGAGNAGGAIDRRLAAVRALRAGSPRFVEAAALEARLTDLRRVRK